MVGGSLSPLLSSEFLQVPTSSNQCPPAHPLQPLVTVKPPHPCPTLGCLGTSADLFHRPACEELPRFTTHRRQRFPRCARGRPPASSSRRPVPQLWLKPGLLPSQPGPGLPWALHSCYSRQPPAPGTPGKDLPCPFIFVQLSNAKSCCPKGSSGGHLGLFSRLALLCVPCRLLWLSVSFCLPEPRQFP